MTVLTSILLSVSSLTTSPMRLNTQDYVHAIRLIAAEKGIDGDLAVAVAQVESKMNPEAIGLLKEVGLFQLRPEYHNVKRGKVVQNIYVAIEYIKEIKEKFKDYPQDSYVVHYNLGPHYRRLNYPLRFIYFTKVKTNYLLAESK